MNDHPFIVSAIHSLMVDFFLASGVAAHLGRWRCCIRSADKDNEGVACKSRITFIWVDRQCASGAWVTDLRRQVDQGQNPPISEKLQTIQQFLIGFYIVIVWFQHLSSGLRVNGFAKVTVFFVVLVVIKRLQIKVVLASSVNRPYRRMLVSWHQISLICLVYAVTFLYGDILKL